ncbi:hypothetical protein MPNT_210035 [Candidatus Methylacidithermus pantelleriae]|uniref:Uncharacterized protein n=1 Tax=Candidatus Methylacidithermus pantelleriae TaxID=2744239 RepID=A0A8J2FW51_9BACT|nr:hypothetical protein MPNT_210035 [Candidatus Methylacidithermus pantelleriae]
MLFRLAPCAFSACKRRLGGEGNRTPVLIVLHASLYMFIRRLVLRNRAMLRRTAGSRASTKSIHEPARSLRRFASLLSSFSQPAGVTAKTWRSIKPRERDLRSLRLFVWFDF